MISPQLQLGDESKTVLGAQICRANARWMRPQLSKGDEACKKRTTAWADARPGFACFKRRRHLQPCWLSRRYRYSESLGISTDIVLKDGDWCFRKQASCRRPWPSLIYTWRSADGRTLPCALFSHHHVGDATCFAVHRTSHNIVVSLSRLVCSV